VEIDCFSYYTTASLNNEINRLFSHISNGKEIVGQFDIHTTICKRCKLNNYKSFTSFIQNYAVLVYIKSCNITLAAQDGVIQLGRDHFILSI
jgi:hypothetical protein